MHASAVHLEQGNSVHSERNQLRNVNLEIFNNIQKKSGERNSEPPFKEILGVQANAIIWKSVHGHTLGRNYRMQIIGNPKGFNDSKNILVTHNRLSFKNILFNMTIGSCRSTLKIRRGNSVKIV